MGAPTSFRFVMLIVNADDWGRSRADTDPALRCFREGRISSATAMVFMEDSARAADLAREVGIDIGMHLNLSQRFTTGVPARLQECHNRIVHFLTRSKYALLLYHPFLREQFRYVYQAQADEFRRLYGKPPSHIDGHQHMHLCTNMLLDAIIPSGHKVRRSFSFWPGEKGALNRAYRCWVDRRLARMYRLTDFFCALSQLPRKERLARACGLARQANVEVMTHPAVAGEGEFLLSNDYMDILGDLPLSPYAAL